MTTEQDTGAYIAELIEQRDDALANLRLREATIRGLRNIVAEQKETIARLDTALYQIRKVYPNV